MTSRLKVLQIHNRYRQRGGEDVVAEREAAALRRAGHRVAELRVRNPGSGADAVGKLLLAPWNPSSYQSVQRACRDFEPDVAHVHNTWFRLSPSVIDSLTSRGIPTVVSLHNYRLMCINGMLLRDGRPCERCVGNSPGAGLRYACYKNSHIASAIAAATLSLNRSKGTYAPVKLFLANSRFLRDRYVAAGVDARKIMIKPNPAPDPGPRTIPPQNSDLLLFVGRISEEKGVRFLVDVWNKATTQGLRLKIVGDGPLREVLERKNPTIEFTGRLDTDDVLAEMLRARCLLFPSLSYEANPLVIIEAFAAGLPVLASNRGAMTEALGPIGAEWVCSPGDLDDWLRGLLLIGDDDRVERAGRLARKAFSESYSSEVVLDKLERAYERAMG